MNKCILIAVLSFLFAAIPSIYIFMNRTERLPVVIRNFRVVRSGDKYYIEQAKRIRLRDGKVFWEKCGVYLPSDAFCPFTYKTEDEAVDGIYEIIAKHDTRNSKSEIVRTFR